MDEKKDALISPSQGLLIFTLFSVFSLMISSLFIQVALDYLFGSVEKYIEISESGQIIGYELKYLFSHILQLSLLFLVCPLIFLSLYQTRMQLIIHRPISPQNIAVWGLAILLFIFLNPLVSYLYESSFHWTFGFEAIKKHAESIKEQYQSVSVAISYLTSGNQVILCYIAIALIPALGEELFFRGMLQNLIFRKTNNPHVSILITATVFSLFHGFSIYGFLPRLLLGALLGYTYYYTKNYFIPVAIHFINNALVITLALLVEYDEAISHLEEMMNTKGFVLIATLLFSLTFYLFIRVIKSKEANYGE